MGMNQNMKFKNLLRRKEHLVQKSNSREKKKRKVKVTSSIKVNLTWFSNSLMLRKEVQVKKQVPRRKEEATQTIEEGLKWMNLMMMNMGIN